MSKSCKLNTHHQEKISRGKYLIGTTSEQVRIVQCEKTCHLVQMLSCYQDACNCIM